MRQDEEDWDEEKGPPDPGWVLVFSGCLLVVILFAFAQVLMNLFRHPDPIMFVPAGVLLLVGTYGMKSVLRALDELAHERIEEEDEE